MVYLPESLVPCCDLGDERLTFLNDHCELYKYKIIAHNLIPLIAQFDGHLSILKIIALKKEQIISSNNV